MPAYVPCIEYAREEKGDQYPWIDLYKATWVADTIIGAAWGRVFGKR